MTPFYMIHADLDGRTYGPEHYPDAANWDDVVKEIVDGRVVGVVSKVWFVDPVEGTLIDMTRDIASAVAYESDRASRELTDDADKFVRAHGFSGYEPPYDDSLVTDTFRHLPRAA